MEGPLNISLEFRVDIQIKYALFGALNIIDFSDFSNTTILDYAITVQDIHLQRMILTAAGHPQQNFSPMLDNAIFKHSPNHRVLLSLMADVHITHANTMFHGNYIT